MTRGSPRLAWFTARRPSAVLAALILGVALVGCEIGFVDRGGSFVADNRSGSTVLARIKSTDKATNYEVVEVPATSRVVLAYQGFGGPVINQVDILSESCESLGTFFGFPQNGRVILIEDGPTATQVREWPDEAEPKAKVVNACSSPDASPTP